MHLFLAENVAKQYCLNQSLQDAFAYESQMKYKIAQEEGNYHILKTILNKSE
jgi:acetyl-CoA acetyltransferase